MSRECVKGKVGVLILFDRECGDWEKELGVIEGLYEEYGGNEEVGMYGMSGEEGEEEVGD